MECQLRKHFQQTDRGQDDPLSNQPRGYYLRAHGIDPGHCNLALSILRTPPTGLLSALCATWATGTRRQRDAVEVLILLAEIVLLS